MGLCVWYIALNTKLGDPAFKFLKILGLLVWSLSNLGRYLEKSYLPRSAFNGFSELHAHHSSSKETRGLEQAINGYRVFSWQASAYLEKWVLDHARGELINTRILSAVVWVELVGIKIVKIDINGSDL
ncbi:hypothetical protein N24_1401 [Corynebacterium suranareeae]|uniref:Uncharacterized protein n=1 Tax=Corynebacterium suranareeae TaxID=2506452 RepID=A0A160PRE6_9CORY|nr:hypothetical protein N24_1401 [Corynebacterium suranareeae]